MSTENNSQAAVRGLKGFQKGMSGNPGGRPKKTQEEYDLIAACKDKSPQALNRIVDIMENGQQERNQLAAATFIIERAYGKAQQTVDVGGELNMRHVTISFVDAEGKADEDRT